MSSLAAQNAISFADATYQMAEGERVQDPALVTHEEELADSHCSVCRHSSRQYRASEKVVVRKADRRLLGP